MSEVTKINLSRLLRTLDKSILDNAVVSETIENGTLTKKWTVTGKDDSSVVLKTETHTLESIQKAVAKENEKIAEANNEIARLTDIQTKINGES